MINVTKSYLPDREKLNRYIDKIYANGWLTNRGEFCQELERRLQAFLGVEHLVLVTNGTLALQVAYKALGLKNKVITTPFSFVATTSSLTWEGLQPVFADIDPRTCNIDPEKIIPLIDKQTTAILPVHVYGNACNVKKIEEIAKEFHLKTIYDGAHAFGVKVHGQSVLNYGDISTLSFHATKLFHTIEGGAIITKDPELYQKIRKLINFGFASPDKIEGMGINAKMSEFQSAMGLCVLDDIDLILAGRKSVFERYQNVLPKEVLDAVPTSDSTKNYSYYPIVLKSENLLLEIKQKLEKIGINTRRYFYPSLNLLDYVEKNNVPVSMDISKRVLCLPMYYDLEPTVIDQISDVIKSLCGEKICC